MGVEGLRVGRDEDVVPDRRDLPVPGEHGRAAQDRSCPGVDFAVQDGEPVLGGVLVLPSSLPARLPPGPPSLGLLSAAPSPELQGRGVTARNAKRGGGRARTRIDSWVHLAEHNRPSSITASILVAGSRDRPKEHGLASFLPGCQAIADAEQRRGSGHRLQRDLAVGPSRPALRRPSQVFSLEDRRRGERRPPWPRREAPSEFPLAHRPGWRSGRDRARRGTCGRRSRRRRGRTSSCPRRRDVGLAGERDPQVEGDLLGLGRRGGAVLAEAATLTSAWSARAQVEERLDLRIGDRRDEHVLLGSGLVVLLLLFLLVLVVLGRAVLVAVLLLLGLLFLGLLLVGLLVLLRGRLLLLLLVLLPLLAGLLLLLRYSSAFLKPSRRSFFEEPSRKDDLGGTGRGSHLLARLAARPDDDGLTGDAVAGGMRPSVVTPYSTASRRLRARMNSSDAFPRGCCRRRRRCRGEPE